MAYCPSMLAIAEKAQQDPQAPYKVIVYISKNYNLPYCFSFYFVKLKIYITYFINIIKKN